MSQQQHDQRHRFKIISNKFVSGKIKLFQINNLFSKYNRSQRVSWSYICVLCAFFDGPRHLNGNKMIMLNHLFTTNKVVTASHISLAFIYITYNRCEDTAHPSPKEKELTIPVMSQVEETSSQNLTDFLQPTHQLQTGQG